MNHNKTQPVMPSVRLFPRLAATNGLNMSKRQTKSPQSQRSIVLSSKEPRDEVRTAVRARLLSMIVENERMRRNERRPTQR